jgi:hypothetical protein
LENRRANSASTNAAKSAWRALRSAQSAYSASFDKADWSVEAREDIPPELRLDVRIPCAAPRLMACQVQSEAFLEGVAPACLPCKTPFENAAPVVRSSRPWSLHRRIYARSKLAAIKTTPDVSVHVSN